MAINVEVNGVTRNAFTRYKTCRIQKDGPVETCRVEFLDRDLTAAAFRVEPGDEIHIDRDGTALEFGGTVERVTDSRLTGLDNPLAPSSGLEGGATVTTVEARGWYFEAADVKIPILILQPQGLFVAAEYLRSTYLAAKGWTMLGPTTGGPDLPLLVYHNNTVAEIFDDLTKQSGHPWRVNGDREMAFVEIGTLVAPHTYTNVNSIVLRGATWVQERVRRATRLLITTGGTGQFVAHHEDRIANGVLTHFPVNVLPPELSASIDNAAGYAIGATSIAVDGLPKSFTFKAGLPIRFGAHSGYQLASDATTDADGKATFVLGAGLSKAVVDDESLTLDSSATVRLELDGTPTFLGGSWTFNTEQAMFVKTGGAPTAGVVVTYKVLINFPATVRSWRDEAQAPDGSFDYEYVKDSELHWKEATDVVQTHEAALVELAYRVEQPKELRIATYEQDVYPWMLAPCSFPERLIEGDYLVQSVVLTDTGRLDQKPRVELTLLEGSNIGRNWRQFWTGKDSGAKYVESTEPPPEFTLPTTNLSMHFDASEIDDLKTTYVLGGPHTGTPADGDHVYVWLEGEGADLIFKQISSLPTPELREATPLMALQCIDILGQTGISANNQSMTLTNNGGVARALSDIITASAYTMLVSFLPETINSTDATYGGEPLIADTAGYWGIFLAKVAGVPQVIAYNYVSVAHYVMVPCSAGNSHVVMVRHEGGNLYISLDGGTESSIASGNTASLGGTPRIGHNVYGPGSYNGRIGEIAVYNAALTGTDLSDAIGYFVSKWLP
jgi:hypothetical protein